MVLPALFIAPDAFLLPFSAEMELLLVGAEDESVTTDDEAAVVVVGPELESVGMEVDDAVVGCFSDSSVLLELF